MAKVAFIGMGVMGFPMATHLAKAGHAVSVFNRTRSKAEDWVRAYGGDAPATPRETAQDADFTMVCVGNDDDVRSVVLGQDGCLAGMKRGGTLIDHTTASATLARELGEAAEQKGLQFVDAPVSGGQSGAVAGKLSIMAGGTLPAFAAAEPVMRAYGANIVHMGPTGSGQLAKMANQIAIAGAIQGLSESLKFAQNAGLDGDKLLEAISKGAAGSWQMDNRARTMLQAKFDFGFAVDWMIKDLQHCLDEAARNGSKLPITADILAFYRELSRDGGGRMDTSSLIERL
jgi:3-hydroxyisobutyrate dehydrogenase-like beta-hydroxyacid dehydrogenase